MDTSLKQMNNINHDSTQDNKNMYDVQQVKLYHTINEIITPIWSSTSYYPILFIVFMCITIFILVFYWVFNYYWDIKLNYMEKRLKNLRHKQHKNWRMKQIVICPRNEIPPGERTIYDTISSIEEQEVKNFFVEASLFSVPSNREIFDQDVFPSTSQTYTESGQMENQERIDRPQQNLKDQEQQIASVQSQSAEIYRRRRSVPEMNVQSLQRRKSSIESCTRNIFVIETEIHDVSRSRDYVIELNSQVQNENEKSDE